MNDEAIRSLARERQAAIAAEFGGTRAADRAREAACGACVVQVADVAAAWSRSIALTATLVRRTLLGA